MSALDTEGGLFKGCSLSRQAGWDGCAFKGRGSGWGAGAITAAQSVNNYVERAQRSEPFTVDGECKTQGAQQASAKQRRNTSSTAYGDTAGRIIMQRVVDEVFIFLFQVQLVASWHDGRCLGNAASQIR